MSMWEFAVEAAVYVYNRTPDKSIDFAEPLDRFAPNVKCHMEKIRRFGWIG